MSHKPGQTLAALLEEGCRRYKNCQPVKNNFETANGQHGTELSIEEFKAQSISRNRKTAQHLAARDVLLQIVRAGRYKDFFIPGDNQAEAEQYILGLQPELGTDEQMANENWPGKCDLLCAQKRINSKPTYDIEAIEEQNQTLKMFKCVCTLKSIIVTEVGTSKKKAKAAAAKRMYDRINEEIQGVELNIIQNEPKNKESKFTEVKEKEEVMLEGRFSEWLRGKLEKWSDLEHVVHDRCKDAYPLFQRVCSVAEKDQQSILKKIWPNMKYKFLLDLNQSTPFEDSMIESLQKDIDHNPILKDEITVFLDIYCDDKCNNVFTGTGKNIAIAKELACCSALMFLKVYVDAHVK
uniref:DRBM domain-containing protein n=1 Tax=Bursaphelenchus xylophilus TaxID=6326 RepID=A0A1I7SWG9_BURXY